MSSRLNDMRVGSGRRLKSVGRAGSYTNPAISPDGKYEHCRRRIVYTLWRYALKIFPCGRAFGRGYIFRRCRRRYVQGNMIKKPFDLTAHPPNKTSSTQILYHGGPIMNQSNSVYAIYYGTFPSTTQPIINDFLVGLSGSPQYGVNHTYNDPTSPNPMPVPLNYAFVAPSSHPNTNPSGCGCLWDSYSQGTAAFRRKTFRRSSRTRSAPDCPPIKTRCTWSSPHGASRLPLLLEFLRVSHRFDDHLQRPAHSFRADPGSDAKMFRLQWRNCSVRRPGYTQ